MIKTIEMTEAIIEAKFSKGASWADISKAAGMSEVFVVSACLGQNTLPAEAAAKLSSTLISATARKMLRSLCSIHQRKRRKRKPFRKIHSSIGLKQALAGVVCCWSPTPSNISNLNSAASVACISGRMPTRSTVAIIGNLFEKFRHCQALSAVARPSLDGIRCLQAPLKST
jgi:hypothetical protein